MLETALGHVICFMAVLVKKQSSCHIGCSQRLLNQLVRLLECHCVIEPGQPQSFLGLSFVSLAKNVEDAVLQQGATGEHVCPVKDEGSGLMDKIKAAGKAVGVLNLDEFRRHED